MDTDAAFKGDWLQAWFSLFDALFSLRPLSALSAQSAVNSDPFDLNHFNRRCLRWSQIMKVIIRADPRDPWKI